MAIEERWHFKGEYSGVFGIVYSGATHAAVFHDIEWHAIEIRNVQRISKRVSSKERVGDFYYQDKIRPGKKWWPGGVDLVIIKDDHKAFSETIYDVVLIKQAGSRSGFSPIRPFDHARTTDREYVVKGIIYFSLPADPPPPPPASSVFNTATVVSHSVNVPEHQDIPVTFPVNTGSYTDPTPTLQNRTGCLSSASGCLNTGGCLSGIFKIARWLFFLFLFLKLIGWIGGLLSKNVLDQREDTGQGNIKTEKPRLDPQQDTLAPQPWNYLVDHQVNWNDFLTRKYEARYSTSTYLFQASGKRHRAWANSIVNDELLFYHDLYQDLYSFDRSKLDSLVGYFDYQRRSRSLDPLSVAEMVITFVQEIPYVLVHDGTCREVVSEGGFVADYHSQHLPCLPNVVAGIHSPYEFAHTMQGDCDTRSLLAFTLLDRLGIGASVWVSREYGHSILGVAVPANSSNYKRVAGTRHFATELTVKGFRVGMIAPEHMDMDNWNIVLNNR